MSKILIPVILENAFLDSCINEIIDSVNTDNFHLKSFQKFNKIDNESEYFITDEKCLHRLEKDFKNIKKIFLINYVNKKLPPNKFYAELIIFNLPFKFSNLMSTINNTIIHSEKYNQKLIKFNNFVYDPRLRKLYDKLFSVRFTEKESQIFMCLLDNSNTQISKKSLLKKVWSYNEDIDTHTLETHIYSLRKKIEKNLKLKDLIIFLDNKGYFLNKKIL